MPYVESDYFDGAANTRANEGSPYAGFQTPPGPGPKGTPAGGTENLRADGENRFGGAQPGGTTGQGTPLPHDTFEDGEV